MQLFVAIVAICGLAMAGLFGFSWMRNPDAGAGVHASAVGFAQAHPLSSGAGLRVRIAQS